MSKSKSGLRARTGRDQRKIKRQRKWRLKPAYQLEFPTMRKGAAPGG